MSSNFLKNSIALLATLTILLPVWYLLFKILPENGVEFWTLVERLSQWKPVVAKGWSLVILSATFLILIGIFIFAASRELDE